MLPGNRSAVSPRRAFGHRRQNERPNAFPNGVGRSSAGAGASAESARSYEREGLSFESRVRFGSKAPPLGVRVRFSGNLIARPRRAILRKLRRVIADHV